MKFRRVLLTAVLLLAVGTSFAFKAKKTGWSAFFKVPTSTTLCAAGITEQDVCDVELTGPVCTILSGGGHQTAYENGVSIPCTVTLRQP